MNLRHIDCFLRVVELGSINRAAPTLAMSQPALSRLIASLEHEMGVEVLSRTQGGVRLTEAGRHLHERARPLLRQFEVLKEQVGEQAAGQLAIGLPPAWQAVVNTTFVDLFARRHGKVKLRVYEGLSNVLHDYMAAGLLDLCVVPFSPIPMAGYRQRSLVREPIALVGSVKDALDSKKAVALSTLEGASLVLPERPNVLRLQIERALERKRTRFRIAVESHSLGMCLDLARRGIGWTFVPQSALVDYQHAAEISWSPIRGQSITWALLVNESREHAQVIHEGSRLLNDCIAKVHRAGLWPGAEPIA